MLIEISPIKLKNYAENFLASPLCKYKYFSREHACGFLRQRACTFKTWVSTVKLPSRRVVPISTQMRFFASFLKTGYCQVIDFGDFVDESIIVVWICISLTSIYSEIFSHVYLSFVYFFCELSFYVLHPFLLSFYCFGGV